jgi:hypothetical protein
MMRKKAGKLRESYRKTGIGTGTVRLASTTRIDYKT